MIEIKAILIGTGKGFDHGEDKTEFEKEGIDTPRERRHFNNTLFKGHYLLLLK